MPGQLLVLSSGTSYALPWETVGVGAPSGTVTFLFTDIEGSTRLWDVAPEAMREALVRHDEILRSAIELHGGYVFATGGDGFAAAFGRAADAIAAATEAQVALAAQDWPFEAPIAVRMGLHTGEVEERGGDYFGSAVNRAARVMAAGHGGQVLISAGTASVAGATGLIDLGEHNLAGLASPEHIFQVRSGKRFPSLRGVGAVPTNLPSERTAFVGRERELGAVATLLRSVRTVTLTGVGGVGKTRLALRVASGMVDEFPGGVWLVELAPLIDAALVPAAVLSAIGAPMASGGEGTDEVVCRFLAQRRALLVLDNCEHVVEVAAALVDRLLVASPRLKVLATSREPLGLAGEAVWRVPSLTVDSGSTEVGDAVALFAERAALVLPTFALNDETFAAVLQVCRRLDGIPLAIELAAARAKAMSVGQISAHLDERFRLLTRGGRTAVARQQTLQGAIDWSYQLLTPAERELFDLLSVFAGDFDLGAAAAVGGGDDLEILDLLDQLTDRSMLEADPSRDRYSLLETLRQYGWDRLAASGQLAQARNDHAEFFTALATEQGRLASVPGREVDALDRLEADYDNLRTALAWLIEEGDAERSELMVRRLIGLFNIRHPLEGLGWFERVVAIAGGLPAVPRSRLLANAAFAAFNAGDPEATGRYALWAIEIGGAEAPALAHSYLSWWQLAGGDVELAVDSARRGVAAAVVLPVKIVAYTALLAALGGMGAEADILAEIPVLLDLAESLGSPTLRTASYVSAAQALDVIGRGEEALAMFHVALANSSEAGVRILAPARLLCALVTDDHAEAGALLREAIPDVRERLSGEPRTEALVPVAKYALSVGAPAEAARLIGAYQREMGQYRHLQLNAARWSETILAQLAVTLNPDVLATELQEGNRFNVDAALDLACDILNRDHPDSSVAPI
jgi:predicted ATPase/class 3 adenylate cyclase